MSGIEKQIDALSYDQILLIYNKNFKKKSSKRTGGISGQCNVRKCINYDL